MDLEQREKLLNEWETRLIQWENELNKKEKQYKLSMAFMNCNSKYLLENYNDYDTKQYESLKTHLFA